MFPHVRPYANIGWCEHVPDWLQPGPIREGGVFSLVKLKLKVAQLYPTLYDPMDYSLTGSSVHGILQARILQWEFPLQGDLSNPGIEPRSPGLQADSFPLSYQGSHSILGQMLYNFKGSSQEVVWATPFYRAMSSPGR